MGGEKIEAVSGNACARKGGRERGEEGKEGKREAGELGARHVVLFK